jgi:hypothetical protein
MVYDSSGLVVFILRPSSVILQNTKEHTVSESESISVLGDGVVDMFDFVRVGFGLFNGSDKSPCLPPSHLRAETDLFSETLCCVVFFRKGTLDKLQKPINPEHLVAKAFWFRELYWR